MQVILHFITLITITLINKLKTKIATFYIFIIPILFKSATHKFTNLTLTSKNIEKSHKNILVLPCCCHANFNHSVHSKSSLGDIIDCSIIRLMSHVLNSVNHRTKAAFVLFNELISLLSLTFFILNWETVFFCSP